jgi:hypothetical protein
VKKFVNKNEFRGNCSNINKTRFVKYIKYEPVENGVVKTAAELLVLLYG